MKKIALSIVALAVGAVTMLGVVEVGRTAYAGPGVIVSQASAPTAGSAVTIEPMATPAPTLPDPVADPVESISFVVKLWKTGTLPATIIVGLFLVLTFLSRKIKALQKGYAALIVASLLGGCAILLESASRGTTPTLQMVWMSLLAAGALFVKGGTPK